MTNKYQWILKRATALLAALLMALSVLPLAAAASADWTELQISVSWYDSTGALQSAAAFPAGETETGEGCFWVLLPDSRLQYSILHMNISILPNPDLSWQALRTRVNIWTESALFPYPLRIRETA